MRKALVVLCLLGAVLVVVAPQADAKNCRATKTCPPTTTTTTAATTTTTVGTNSQPPPPGGYFTLAGKGAWSTLPSGTQCASMVHRSTWEPRPDNYKRNHTLVDPAAVRQSFASRPYDSSWVHFNDWLHPRVDGQFTGTTDEIFQWAACKWGIPDDVLRAMAVRESTWYQDETYPSGRCVLHFSCGDLFTTPTADSNTYCDHIATFGYDYQRDYGDGLCPKTFGIVGVMSWEAPGWGQMADNQNGAFPFNRDSTAFAVDYVGSYLRGCMEGWITWLSTGDDLWGCVGSWYSGDWHSSAAETYISNVKAELANYTWLQAGWASDKPGCSTTYGCPGPDQL